MCSDWASTHISHESSTQSNMLPEDFSARQAALNPQLSFAVSAPAGSGKTGLLTQRMLKLLSLCEYPEEVLAITFTRKAAGEMQDRILQALWQAQDSLIQKNQAQEDPSANTTTTQNTHEQTTRDLALRVLQQDKSRDWHLLECPQRLRIQTIDSLCSSISQQLPISNGFGAALKPKNDCEVAYREAVHQILLELEKDSTLQEDLCILLRHLDNQVHLLEKLLIHLLAKRDQWLSAILQAGGKKAREYLEQVLKDIVDECLAKAHAALRLHDSELACIADWAGNNLQKVGSDSPFARLAGYKELPKPHHSNINDWSILADFLLTKSGSFRKKLTAAEGFPPKNANKESEQYKTRFAELVNLLTETHSSDIINEIRDLPPINYTEKQWTLLNSLTRILPRLAAQLQLVFAESGETDFIAISQAALAALGEEDSPTDIALQLDYRIRHILVDEFQDTSSTQLQLLEKLTAGWQPNDGRSLFIVGDGMQSCYGFRNANVGIFLEARQNGIGSLPLTALDLTVNFRSQAGIVEWVNTQFTAAFPAEDDIGHGAVKYSASTAFKEHLQNNAVDIYISAYQTEKNKPLLETSSRDTNSNTEDDEDIHSSSSIYLAELQENEKIAQLIVELHKTNPNDTIALLARNRAHLQTIFTTLNQFNLRWQATDIDKLADRMAIIDLTSLTRALLDFSDRIAWLAILRAPWAGLDLHDLHTLANTPFEQANPIAKKHDFPLIWQQVLLLEKNGGLSKKGQLIISRFVAVIKPALEQRQRKPLRQWLEGIWLALGGPATLLDPSDIQNIPTFFSLVEQHQQGGVIPDWQTFNNAINRLYATPQLNNTTKLHVMTLHKSKGLEFDHVIIPRLHKTPTKDDEALLLWRERLSNTGERQLLLGPLTATGEIKDKLYAYIKKETAQQLAFEATRLFYVGCTRAIKKLYLFASLTKLDLQEEQAVASTSELLKSPPERSLLHSIWAQVKAQVKLIQPTEQFNKADENLSHNLLQTGLQHLVRLPPEWNAPALLDDSPLIKYRGKEYYDENNIPTANSLAAKLAQHTGILIHQSLQSLVKQQLVTSLTNHAQEQWLELQQNFWKVRLREQGYLNEEINQAIRKITLALQNSLNDSQGQWILNHSHEQSACELAISFIEGDKLDLKLRDNIIDRTFVENGVRWIIDYKTSEPTDGEPIPEFIAREINHYLPQLKKYRECFSALGETTIKTALYFPLLTHHPKLIEV